MSVKISEIRDRAGDIIPNTQELLKKFKIWIFSILGYNPWKNDAEIIKFLNIYRTKLNKNTPINNIDYNPKTDKKAA
jgi:hypothetical protein